MNIPDAYYRISVKALVFDAEGRLLVVKNDEGGWEIPGGGWEHKESLQECLARELKEELRAGIKQTGDVTLHYRGTTSSGYPKLSLAVPVSLDGGELTPDDDIIEAKYVTKDEFLNLKFEAGEDAVQSHADQIWSQH